MLDEIAERLLSRAALIGRGLFDPVYRAACATAPPTSPYSQERVYRLWSLILTEMWCRMYLDAPGSTANEYHSPGERVSTNRIGIGLTSVNHATRWLDRSQITGLAVPVGGEGKAFAEIDFG